MTRAILAMLTAGIAFWLFATSAPWWWFVVLVVISAFVFWGCWGNITIFLLTGTAFQMFFMLCDALRHTSMMATFGWPSGFLFWGIAGVILFKVSSSIFERIHRVHKDAYLHALGEYFSDLAMFGSRPNGKY